MKQVRERNNHITAYVVLTPPPEFKPMATVHFYRTPEATQCDVYDKHKLVHQSKATGYGYDRATSALAGAGIDGYTMADHCGTVELPAMLEAKAIHSEAPSPGQVDRLRQIGFCFANGRLSVYPYPGLERLEAMGYTVIQAI